MFCIDKLKENQKDLGFHPDFWELETPVILEVMDVRYKDIHRKLTEFYTLTLYEQISLPKVEKRSFEMLCQARAVLEKCKVDPCPDWAMLINSIGV